MKPQRRPPALTAESLEIRSTTTTPADAINRSITHDEIVRYEGSLDVLLAYATEQGYETDSARENDDSIDVWGWTDETADNEQDWRVNVMPIAAESRRS